MITYSEAKMLVARWGKGTQPSREENIRYHVHERGNDDLCWYLRKAYNFNKKGAATKPLPDDRLHHERKSSEILIKHDGYIIRRKLSVT